jgi:plastocyanin
MQPPDARRPPTCWTSLLFAATVSASLALAVALAPSSSAQGVAISIIDNDYDPATVVVAIGTEVTWTNRGELLHDVVALRGEFRSRRFRTGESFSFVFDEPGTYDYQCTVHWSMSGTIEVRGAPDSPDQLGPTPQPSEEGRTVAAGAAR